MSTIAVIGAGTVGVRVARQLAAVNDVDKLILGTRHPLRIKSLSRQLLDVDVEVIAPGRLPDVDTVVLALPPGGHAKIAEEAIYDPTKIDPSKTTYGALSADFKTREVSYYNSRGELIRTGTEPKPLYSQRDPSRTTR